MTMRAGLTGLLVSGALALWSASAQASEGLYLLGTDALQVGRADSGTASPRSAYWAWLNPATLTRFEERQIDTSLMVIFEKISLKPRGPFGNPIERSLNADSIIGLPTTGIIYPIAGGEKGVLAGGIFPMGGGSVEYDHGRSILGRLLYGNRDRKNALQHVQLGLSYGYPLGNGWSVGAGVQLSVTRIRTDQLTLRLAPTRTNNKWDETYGIGFNLGIFKEWDNLAIGASYKSPQWSQPMNDYRDLIPDSLDYPHTVRVGVAWQPNDRWEITADYEYQRWSQVPPFGEPVLATGLAWKDLHAYKIGVEWKAIVDKLTLMAGYSHSKPVITEDHLFANLFVPTIIQDHYTAGLTWHLNERHDIHFAYLRSAKNSMTQNLGGDLISLLGAGSKSTVSANSFILGYTWKF